MTNKLTKEQQVKSLIAQICEFIKDGAADSYIEELASQLAELMSKNETH